MNTRETIVPPDVLAELLTIKTGETIELKLHRRREFATQINADAPMPRTIIITEQDNLTEQTRAFLATLYDVRPERQPPPVNTVIHGFGLKNISNRKRQRYIPDVLVNPARLPSSEALDTAINQFIEDNK